MARHEVHRHQHEPLLRLPLLYHPQGNKVMAICAGKTPSLSLFILGRNASATQIPFCGALFLFPAAPTEAAMTNDRSQAP